MTYFYAVTQGFHWQEKVSWQAPDTPFMTFEYWQALTDTSAIGEASGWVPLYIEIYNSQTPVDPTQSEQLNANLIAVMPVFIKGHHQGEYVFDHAWADAYARYGVDYYPRLVTSVPYTPVTGQRLWLAEGVAISTEIIKTALKAVDDIASQAKASSWHGLFLNDDFVNASTPLMADIAEIEQRALSMQAHPIDSLGQSLSESGPVPFLLERQGCQFLWHNQRFSDSHASTEMPTAKFTDFDDFLSTLTAKKRKNIRAERRKIAKQNLSCQLKTGDEITDDDWEVFFQCYAMTYAVRGRHPYLTLEFFKQIGESIPQHLMLAQGRDESGQIVASSLFFFDDPSSSSATLYGRYWGALEEYDSLHFELCYYLGIEFAIAKGLQYFDPGTQGEHKLIRGFVPIKTHSLHRIYDLRFEPAIAKFCEQDRAYMQTYRQHAHEALPFNIDNMPDFKG